MEPLTLDKILLESCSNPYYGPDFDWSTFHSATSQKPEWNEYRIETHCLAYLVIAKLNEDQQTYTIRSYTVIDI